MCNIHLFLLGPLCSLLLITDYTIMKYEMRNLFLKSINWAIKIRSRNTNLFTQCHFFFFFFSGFLHHWLELLFILQVQSVSQLLGNLKKKNQLWKRTGEINSKFDFALHISVSWRRAKICQNEMIKLKM